MRKLFHKAIRPMAFLSTVVMVILTIVSWLYAFPFWQAVTITLITTLQLTTNVLISVGKLIDENN